MPTSVGDPAAGQRLNIPSLPKDAEIRINAGQYESRANPRPQSLGIIEIRSVRQIIDTLSVFLPLVTATLAAFIPQLGRN